MKPGQQVSILIYQTTPEGEKIPCGLMQGTIVSQKNEFLPNGKKISGFNVLLGDKVEWYEKNVIIAYSDTLKWSEDVYKDTGFPRIKKQ